MNVHRNRDPFHRTKVPAYVYAPVLFTGGVMVYCYYSCLDEAPFTKRKRLIATSPEMEIKMGDDQYKELLKQYKGSILPKDHRASITVQRVGSRVAAAAQKFGKKYNAPSVLLSSPPTYTVVRSDIPNAFVLPNNHIFVLTGLFQYVKDEDELAAVLSHEMAHNLARHAGEKVSSTILIQIMARVLLMIDPSGLLFYLFMPAASLLHELPNSREAEIEADHIGLYLASEACYEPNASIRVFSAMKHGSKHATSQPTKKSSSASNTMEPPEFISTHPSYDSRLSNFHKWMPDALELYNMDDGLKCRHLRHEMSLERKKASQLAWEKEIRSSKRIEAGASSQFK